MQPGDLATAALLGSQSCFFLSSTQYDEDGNEIGIVPIFDPREINFTVNMRDYEREEITFTEIECKKEEVLEEKPGQPDTSNDTCTVLLVRFSDNGKCEIVSETEQPITEVLGEIDDLSKKNTTVACENVTPSVYIPGKDDLDELGKERNVEEGRALERTFSECVEDCMGILHVTPKNVESTECFLCSFGHHYAQMKGKDVDALCSIFEGYGKNSNAEIALQLHLYFKEYVYTPYCGMPMLTEKIALEHIEVHRKSPSVGHSAVQIRK